MINKYNNLYKTELTNHVREIDVSLSMQKSQVIEQGLFHIKTNSRLTSVGRVLKQINYTGGI